MFIILGGTLTFLLTNKTEEKSNKPNVKNAFLKDNVITLLEVDSLIELDIDTLGEELPSTKEEGYLPVKMNISLEKDSVEVFGEIRVQGTSTARWPKKNWTLKFYSDEEREHELKLKVGNSIPSDKWIAKADWIDPDMIRNGVSYKLWDEIIKSRKGENKYEVEYVNELNPDKKIESGATGYPNYYTARIKMNGEHYGITTLLLGHDPDNFNIDQNNPKHLFLEFDSRGRYDFEGMEKIYGWERFKSSHLEHHVDSYYPKNEDYTPEQKTAIDRFGEFINGDMEIFEKDYNKHLDKTNMIDMLIYIEFLFDWDAVSQDIQAVTYDLEKWFILPWDKDTSFGLNYDTSGLFDSSIEKLAATYTDENDYNRPWHRTFTLFNEEVESRYAELRRKNILSSKNIEKLINSIQNKVPARIWHEEYLRWSEFERPSSDGINKNQMITWTEDRLEMLDKHFNYN